MCSVLAVGVRREFRFSTALQVACMRLSLDIITWGAFSFSTSCYTECLPLCSFKFPLCRLLHSCLGGLVGSHYMYF